jgi:hypothetical protein
MDSYLPVFGYHVSVTNCYTTLVAHLEVPHIPLVPCLIISALMQVEHADEF